MDLELTRQNDSVLSQVGATQFEAGQVLDSKYEVLSLLGRGGMGSVYRVRHLLLNVELALKTLDTQRIGDASSSRRFQTEAKAAFSLKHPNLVKVHHFGVFDDVHPFLVMDLVQGKTLQTLIQERGQLNLDEIESIFVQLCFGLSHAHRQQVVHRDIKPANIMLVDGVPLSAEGSVKILDFGIAKIVNADRGEMQTLTQTGEVFGSPFYMSPEQCSGATIDQRSDVYSLGCVLFEALTGTPPHVGSNALRTMMLHVNENAPTLKEATLGSEYPEELEALVAKMLAKSSGDRYLDLGVVAHDLSGFCAANRAKSSNESDQSDKGKKITAKVEKKRALTVSLTKIQLAMLIFSTALVALLCTVCFDNYFNAGSMNKQNAAEKNGPSFEEMPEEYSDNFDSLNAKTKESFLRVLNIKGTPIGPEEQRIVFPDVAIGRLRHGNDEGCSAKGAVIVPIKGPLWLEVSAGLKELALNNAFVFEKIDANLLTGLAFTGIDKKSTLFIFEESKLRKWQERGAEQLFAAAAKWKRLDHLKLQDVKLAPSLLDEMDKLHLKYVHFNRVIFPPHSLDDREIFKRVRELVIEDGDTSALLAEAAKSSSIRCINICSHMTAKSVAGLENCKNLKTLVFGIHGLPPAVVMAASKLKNVSVLIFRDNELSKTQMNELSKHWQQVPSLHRDTVRFQRKA